MYISKAQLEAIQFASNDATREALSGLYITENEVVATDGHRMMVVEHSTPELANNEARGKWNKIKDHFLGLDEPKLPGTLDGDTVRSLLKAWPKVKKIHHQEWHDWAWIGKDSIKVLDINEKFFTFPASWIDGKYPNFKQVLPTPEERPIRFGVSCRYMADAVYLADERSKMVEFQAVDHNHSYRMEGVNEAGQKSVYVVMPMRIDEPPQSANNRFLEQVYTSRMIEAKMPVKETLEQLEPLEVVEIQGKVYRKADLDALFEVTYY